MPLYEYRCRSCDRVSEILVAAGDAQPGLACTHCGSTDLHKQFSVTNVQRYPGPAGGKTCCGRSERCDSEKGCCGQ